MLLPIDMQHQPTYNYGSLGERGIQSRGVQQASYDRTSEQCFFEDGLRKIDFLLVYEESTSDTANVDKVNGTSRSKAPSHIAESSLSEGKQTADKQATHSKWRRRYLRHLKEAGLQLEEVMEQRGNTTTHYVKCHAPPSVLYEQAEKHFLKMPLQLTPNSWKPWSAEVLEKCHLPNIMTQHVPHTPPSSLNALFQHKSLAKFAGSSSPATFFKNKDRQALVYHILCDTAYGRRSRAEIGIDRLIHDKIFCAAFPLHDGHAEAGNDVPDDVMNARQVLRTYWARAGVWYKYQPLEHVREYFGEEVAFYFAWLGFYTSWLLPAAIVGIIVFLYGLYSVQHDVPVVGLSYTRSETCTSGEDYLMCPLCDNCDYWYLSASCIYAVVGYICDNTGTVFLAVFISFWAACFLENWKRTNITLAYYWDTMGFEEEDEKPRPEFAAKCRTLAENPITGVMEPYFSDAVRLTRITSAVVIILMMVCVVLICAAGLIVYSIVMGPVLDRDPPVKSLSSIITSISGSLASLVIIMILGTLYEKLAHFLTEWEMHRTQSQFEDHLNLKVFIFQFVNYYSTVFYLAFFKGRFIGYPGNYVRIFGIRNEDCGVGGCLFELAEQLAIIFVGKQLISNVQEVVIPQVKLFLQRRRAGHSELKEDKPVWRQEYEDLIECGPLLGEYLEMIIQYGFVTLFVCAFPLAPFFAMLNNWAEIRIDSRKFVCEFRRPVAKRAEDIGIWFSILETLSLLAVITNAVLIAFTSDFIPRLMYKYHYDDSLRGYVNFTLASSPDGSYNRTCRYKDFRDTDGNLSPFFWQLMTARLAFIVVFQNIVMGIAHLIAIIVPDVPEQIDTKIKRQRFVTKQTLMEHSPPEQDSTPVHVNPPAIKHRPAHH